jgi:hypothetical protein
MRFERPGVKRVKVDSLADGELRAVFPPMFTPTRL